MTELETTKATPHASPASPRLPFLLLTLLLAADVSAYLFEKIACNHAAANGESIAAAGGSPATAATTTSGQYLLTMLHQPFFWAALALGPIQLFLWTKILARCDLSKAYPISGLNMPLTLVASTLLLGEKLPWPVWTGAALITLGGAIIGPGPGKAHHPPQTLPG